MFNILENAKETLVKEAEAIMFLIPQVDSEFEAAVKLIHSCKGKLIVIGLGKSGIIGQKFASTLASVGTPAIFLHATEALHGSLGIFSEGDVAFILSNSGETKEAIQLSEWTSKNKIKTIFLTGKKESILARNVDITLIANTEETVCPLGLAPMASTTITLALCDALATSLMKLKEFTKADFVQLHPAGSLGKK